MNFRWTKHRVLLAQKTWVVALIVFCMAFIAVSGVQAREKLPLLIQFSIQDENGNFFYEGEIEFCTPDGECIFADIQPGFPGHFFLPSQDIQAGVSYTVFVYDPQVTVLFEMRGWTFDPADYDPGHNSYWKLDQFLIFPQFRAHKDRRLTFQLDTTLNPEWKVVSGLGYGDVDLDNLPDWPEFMATIQVPFMLGSKFTSDETAAGGVIKVKPGIGLTGTWRFNYPKIIPERNHWIPFREITLAYNQNRYETLGVYYPGRESDVTLHRFTFSYGLGKMDQIMKNQWSLSVAAGYGGIYDGGELLRYLDRNYSMFGLGVQGRFIRGIYESDRLNIGLTGQLEWMYYLGDHLDNDFWYGSAPAVQIGLTVY